MLTSSNCDDCLSCLRNETPKRASTARNTYGNRGIRRKSLTIGTHMALMAKVSSEESNNTLAIIHCIQSLCFPHFEENQNLSCGPEISSLNTTNYQLDVSPGVVNLLIFFINICF